MFTLEDYILVDKMVDETIEKGDVDTFNKVTDLRIKIGAHAVGDERKKISNYIYEKIGRLSQ